LYFGQFTAQGVLGIEFGNSPSRTSTSAFVTGVPSGSITTTTALVDTFDVKTRFFDQINLKYYFNDDFSGYVGHRYLGGKNALALGAELAAPLGGGRLGSAFVEARIGENDNHGIWGGLKLYFGPTDKPLLARHRRDDPNNWTGDVPLSLANSQKTSASSTSVLSCPLGVKSNGNCEAPIVVSDRRLKRDIVLLARRRDGIGIYRYRYLWSDTVYVGVMAQEVAAIMPDAVMCPGDGFMRVNYARLGMRLLTWTEWQAGMSIARIAA
jgi:hypothetical protein